MTAAVDAPLARRIIDENITDPRMRSQALEMVENAARGLVMPTGPAIRSPVTGPPVQNGVLIAPNGIVGAAPGGAIMGPPPAGIRPAPPQVGDSVQRARSE
jgi:hypothetical protein